MRHIKQHALINSDSYDVASETVVRRYNYITSKDFLNDKSVEDAIQQLEHENGDDHRSLAVIAAMQGKLILQPKGKFAGAHYEMDMGIIQKIIDDEDVSLENVVRRDRTINDYFSTPN